MFSSVSSYNSVQRYNQQKVSAFIAAYKPPLEMGVWIQWNGMVEWTGMEWWNRLNEMLMI